MYAEVGRWSSDGSRILIDGALRLLEYTSVTQISEPLCVSLLNGSLGAPMIRHGAVNLSLMW